MVTRASEIHVANVCGPGVGRFLATTLADALEGGAALVAVERSACKPRRGEQAVDFVFASQDPHDCSDEREVIRVGLDATGQVVCTEIVRWSPGATAPPPGNRSGGNSAVPPDRAPLALGAVGAWLLDALRSGDSVSALHWTSHSTAASSDASSGASSSASSGALAITIRSHQQFEFPIAVPSGDP